MDWGQLVREVMEEARRKAGSGAALASQLEAAGVGPEGGRYSDSGISNWIKGRTMPPADVLLATAHVGGISLDQRIDVEGTDDGRDNTHQAGSGDNELRREVQELRRQYARLETLLMDLYSRTGQPYPHERTDDDRQDRRAVRA